MAGAAYYVIDDTANPVIPNVRYAGRPPLTRMTGPARHTIRTARS